MKELFNSKAEIQTISLNPWGISGSVDMLREDALHPLISGNKIRKLKHWTSAVSSQNKQGMVTFGGAYSNHILATAARCYQLGLECVLLVRVADENAESPTIAFAKKYGALVKSISRSEYRARHENAFQEKVQKQYPHLLVVPEGGSGVLGQKGVAEMVDPRFAKYTHVGTAVGTGGTLLGLKKGLEIYPQCQILGCAAVPEKYLNPEVKAQIAHLWYAYLFGGYAKVDKDLVGFIKKFWVHTGVLLDPVYTGKMMYGIMDHIAKGTLPEQGVLAIHTGGLQGLLGMPNHFEWAFEHLPQCLVGKQ